MPNDSHVSAVVTMHVERIPVRLKMIQGERSQRQWSAELGIPQAVLQRYLVGNRPEVEFFINVSRKENINLNWLLWGNGEAYRNES